MSKNYVNTFRGDHFYTPEIKTEVKSTTPIDEDFGDHNNLDISFENYGTMRKSMSMSDIAALNNEISGQKSFERQDSHQRLNAQSNNALETSRKRFVSMAEAIYHFQRDTPGRFHTTRPQIFRSQGQPTRLQLTRPQSPVLRVKARSRPLHFMSQQEKEEMEIEEMKKFKIKANPIPKSVIEGTVHLPVVSKKPITIPEPFNLTELQKKLPVSPEVHTFKARPAPKHILEKPHISVKPPVQTTKPVSPKFHYKRTNSLDQLKPKTISDEKLQPPQRHGPVKPIPFSFEKHDEERKKRKEHRIKQQIELEKKQASSFKAQPVPEVVKKRMQSTTKSSCSTESSENKENNFKFEAKPPVVLYKEPFKPVLQSTHIVKPEPFSLASEKRAAEREKYDKYLKEKEEEMERLRQQKEKEQLEVEKRTAAELRAKLVHHAKPVPNFDQFVPQKSVAPITVPETPKFVRRLRQN